MTKKDKSQEETTLTPALEEPTSASGLNFGQKVFSHSETIVTIEVEGFTGSKAELPVPEPLPESGPKPPPPVELKVDAPKGVTPTVATTNLKRTLASPTLGPPPSPRSSFFSPVLIVLALAATGFYFYERSRDVPLTPTADAEAPAPAAPAFRPNEAPISPVVDLNKPVPAEQIEEQVAAFSLKSDTDDFRVLVNGKDMPVISGKITLPLNQQLDIRFVRRGYKEIQVKEEFKKPESRDLVLKFEKDPNAPPPRRLYN